MECAWYFGTAHGMCLILWDGTWNVPDTLGRHMECAWYFGTAHGMCLILCDGTWNVPDAESNPAVLIRLAACFFYELSDGASRGECACPNATTRLARTAC
jgi:hypothetical protein